MFEFFIVFVLLFLALSACLRMKTKHEANNSSFPSWQWELQKIDMVLSDRGYNDGSAWFIDRYIDSDALNWINHQLDSLRKDDIANNLTDDEYESVLYQIRDSIIERNGVL